MEWQRPLECETCGTKNGPFVECSECGTTICKRCEAAQFDAEDKEPICKECY